MRFFLNKLNIFFIGELGTFPLERKIHVLLTSIMLVIGLVGSLANLAFHTNFWSIVFTFGAVLIIVVFYILSNKLGYYKQTAMPLVLSSLPVLAVVWFTNAGYNGNIINLIFVSFLCMYIIALQQYRVLVFVLYLLLISALVLIQYIHPEWIISYENEKQRFVDIFVGNVMYFLFLYLIIRIVFDSYMNENRRVNSINLQLTERNNEVLENYNKLKQTELELIAAKEQAEESDRLKTSFLANMSHEIRTPMNGIMGFAHLLKNQNLSGEKQQQYIDIIERSGKRMLSLINDLVDISKIESGLMNVSSSEVNINDMLMYLHKFFMEEARERDNVLTLNSVMVPDESMVMADKEKLYAVLMNLLKNSIKYTGKGLIQFGCTRDGDWLCFRVNDTGIGIPKEKQSMIFNRFVQVHDESDGVAYEGAGLGLAITKAYVDMMQGNILVESTAGKGTEFTVLIPWRPVTRFKTGPDHPQAASVQPYRKLKILIAEDEESSGFLLSEIIQSWSADIYITRNGREAVDLCKRQDDIDLVLMDIKMPVLDGLSAIREIREFNKDMVIIAQSAYALTGDRETAMDAGANEYLSKPVSSDQLYFFMRKFFSPEFENKPDGYN
jgi:signal transduction histidine kinase/ActR/RegA family two-component response regulator